VHVACQTGELVTLPASGGDPTRVLNLGRDLRDVIADSGRLLISRFKSAELLVVDGSGQITRTLTPADSSGSFGSSGFEPSIAWRMLPLPNGEVAMLHQRANPAQIAIGPAGYYSGAGSCGGAIVEGTVSRLDPDDDGAGYNPPPPPMAMLIGPSDLAVSRDGANIALVSIGTAWPATRSGSPVNLPKIQIIPSLSEPSDPCGTQPSADAVTGEPIAVAFDGAGRPVVQSREPAQIQVLGGPTISLSSDSRADTGVALFHMNSGFGISCASCHPEGTEDGRTWEFAEIGPRRTQSVAGGVLATAPFHWTGDVEDFTALIHEVFESRMGGTRPNKPQIAAFSSWVDGVPTPNGRVIDTAAVDRGRALFDDANVGCSGCHSGERLTNNQSYDVGTGGVFQVPSLLGIGARAPFLHSGCAPTLHDRFGSCGGGDKHGVTSSLSSAQLDDLVAYLETL
jgi:mono/diheme cytochrome c family protein